MAKKIFDKVKGFLAAPDKAFKGEAKTELGEAFKYGLVGLAIMGFLLGVIVSIIPIATMPLAAPVLFLMIFGATLVLGFLGLLIGGLWLHLWAYVFGARKSIEQTLKVRIYAETPSFYLGWIPLLGVITQFIWTPMLAVKGLKQLQKLSTGNAVAAVIIAILPKILLIIIYMAVIFGLILSGLQGTPTGMFNLFS